MQFDTPINAGFSKTPPGELFVCWFFVFSKPFQTPTVSSMIKLPNFSDLFLIFASCFLFRFLFFCVPTLSSLVSLVVSFSFMFVELASMTVVSSCCCWVLWRTCWYLWRHFLQPTFHQGCDGSVGHSPAVDYLFTSLPQGGSDEFQCNDCRQAKDVIKQLKKRITNKNAAIQILALTVSVNFKCEETVNQGLAARNLLGCVFAVSGCMHVVHCLGFSCNVECWECTLSTTLRMGCFGCRFLKLLWKIVVIVFISKLQRKMCCMRWWKLWRKK